MKPLVNEIYKMLQDRPEVKTSENWPNENVLYSIAGIKKYMLSKGYTSDMTDQAMYQIANSKDKLSYINVYNNRYKENYPYFYANLNNDEVQEAKALYESHQAS